MSRAQLAALQPAERAEIARALDDHDAAVALRTHRTFSESPHWCGLTLSPLMAAIMDAAEGLRPARIDDATCTRHFGCTLDELPRVARRLVAIRAGGRAGKTSRLFATKALHAALTVPLPTLAPGERAVALLMAPDLKLAHQILGFARGYTVTSPRLGAMVARDTADEIELLRPDGQRVLVRVRAASGRGKGGRGFVLVFFGCDEAAFFRDEGSGVVNDTEIYRAAAQRLAPGAQAWLGSTPWVAGVGLLEETMASDFGSHTHALCAQAPTRALNPTWDEDGSLERWMRETDPDNAEREIDAIPFAAGSSLFFDKVTLDAATDERRPQDLAPEPGVTYGAAGDFAFRRNASALAIVRRDGERYALALLDERQPTASTPLAPAAVVDDFAAPLTRFGVDEVATDSHERDDVSAEMARHDVTVTALPEGQAGKAEQYLLTRRLLREGRLSLPKHPRLRAQLNAITSKPAPGGGLSIHSPRTPDGAHGDLVSALVGAVWKASQHRGDAGGVVRSGSPRARRR